MRMIDLYQHASAPLSLHMMRHNLISAISIMVAYVCVNACAIFFKVRYCALWPFDAKSFPWTC